MKVGSGGKAGSWSATAPKDHSPVHPKSQAAAGSLGFNTKIRGRTPLSNKGENTSYLH